MAKSKEEKEVKRSRGNNTVAKSFKNLSKTISLWGQFIHRLPMGGITAPPKK
jgi:hypothetical protein